jgi:hypothetical protein
MFSKKYIFILILNIFLVVFINIIAYLFNYQVNLNIFIYILAFLVIISFIAIIIELCTYIFKEIKNRNYYLSWFLLFLFIFFILKFYYFWDYFYFRYENYLHFSDYFLKSFSTILNNLLFDFRNFNWVVLINTFNNFFPSEGYSQYYIYNFFQFLSWIFLYRLFNLFSKDKLLPILLVLIYFWIEFFFIISYTISYVNIILASFIIFLFYLFKLEKEKDTPSYIFYILSYLFLITSRPDFFFLALIIEFLNSYLKTKNIISLWKNIFFYIFLIPYYFIINNYLKIHISTDTWLLWKTYETDNFWYIFFDKLFSNEAINTLLLNIKFIFSDILFFILFLFIFVSFILFLFLRKYKNYFNIIFLFTYSIFFFFIVISIHREWFLDSFFKYFSIIYLIIFIIFWLFILKIWNFLKKHDHKIMLYIILLVFFIFNIQSSISNYNKLIYYVYSWYSSEAIFELATNKLYNNINYNIYKTLIYNNILYKNTFLEQEINNWCKNILMWDFSNDYNQLFSEYRLKPRYYKYVENKECINYISIREWNYINFTNIDNKLLKIINDDFEIVRVYDKYIDDKFWLNLYILKNKNVK